MRGQIFLQEGQWREARSELDQAGQVIAPMQTNDNFNLKKLNLILTGLETSEPRAVGGIEETSDPLSQLGGRPRGGELISLKIQFEKNRFSYLFYGTPFPAFRDRIVRELGHLPDGDGFILGPPSTPRFDLRDGKINGKVVLRPGGKIHQLIESLLRDFYQPLRMGGIFSALFPSEHFDISSSQDRVHQSIYLTRRWLAQHRIPVVIREDHGGILFHCHQWKIFVPDSPS